MKTIKTTASINGRRQFLMAASGLVLASAIQPRYARADAIVFGIMVPLIGQILVLPHVNNETCIMLSHTHSMTRSWLCDRRNCISLTRIVS